MSNTKKKKKKTKKRLGSLAAVMLSLFDGFLILPGFC